MLTSEKPISQIMIIRASIIMFDAISTRPTKKYAHKIANINCFLVPASLAFRIVRWHTYVFALALGAF